MRRLAFFLVIVAALSSFTNPQLLVGQWQVVGLSFENGQSLEISEKWIAFSRDGIIKSGKLGDRADKSGEWEFHCPENSISILFESDEMNNGEFTIEELTKNKLVLASDTVKILLRRIDNHD